MSQTIRYITINLLELGELIMKMTPELTRVQKKMAPGNITSTGFLGEDSRSLADIIQADEEAAAALGLDWDVLSEKLAFFLKQAKGGLEQPVTIENKWVVTIKEARGFLPCPFADGLFRKHTVEVKHIPSQLIINFSELSLHLLKVHHFLQGKGSPFRLEPLELKKVSE